MARVTCQYCGYKDEEEYLFWCPTHGQFHNDGGVGICGKIRTRCDGISSVSCPVCGLMPCRWCHGLGVERNSNEICHVCGGTKKEPFRLRKIPRKESRDFKKEMLIKAKRIALGCSIRYLYIRIDKKNEHISLSDVRQPGWSNSIPLDKEQRRNFYGWLHLFSKGKSRRFKYKWKELIE